MSDGCFWRGRVLPGHHGAVPSCRLTPSTHRVVTVPAWPRQAFERVSPGPCSIGTRGVSCLPHHPAISQHAPPCTTQGMSPKCHCCVKGTCLRNRSGWRIQCDWDEVACRGPQRVAHWQPAQSSWGESGMSEKVVRKPREAGEEGRRWETPEERGVKKNRRGVWRA